MSKILIGISSCLLGQAVRYDGGHKRNDYIIETLGMAFDFKPFCPEVSIGLGTPREPIRLIRKNRKPHSVGVKNPDLDVTTKLTACANEQLPWQQQICGYILKKDSPSCGMERVKVFTNDMPRRNGVGIYARQMMKNLPCLPVEEEGRLCDPVLRENFIQRVFIYQRWKTLMAHELTTAKLTEFHARHKLIYMSHDQDQARDLGRMLSGLKKKDRASTADAYLLAAMEVLKIPASKQNHSNVLQHIQGYLKRHLDKDDKEELRETIDQYHRGLVPLIVPVTLLKHHFRRCPNTYIHNSYYLQPHPQELMLRNNL